MGSCLSNGGSPQEDVKFGGVRDDKMKMMSGGTNFGMRLIERRKLYFLVMKCLASICGVTRIEWEWGNKE